MWGWSPELLASGCNVIIFAGSGLGLIWLCCLQVLANPSVDLLEGPSVTKEQLKSLGVRPYGPKVGSRLRLV